MSKSRKEPKIRLLLSERGALARIKESGKKFYVYVIYGGTLGPLYVGKGTGDRLRDHTREALKFLHANPNLPYDRWLATDVRLRSKVERLAAHLTYAPLRYAIALFTDDENKAYSLERKLIARYGLAKHDCGVLSNISNGWRTSIGAETRRKISDRHIGRKQKPSVGRKISRALTGRVVPEHTRLRMAEGQRGRKLCAEVRAKISQSRYNSRRIKRVCVEIHGRRYDSMVEAAEKSGYNYGAINYRLRIGYPGFKRLEH